MASNRANVTLNDGTVVEVEKGTTIYELSKTYQPKMKNCIVGAEIDNETVPMETKITRAMTIEFIDATTTNGYKMNKYGRINTLKHEFVDILWAGEKEPTRYYRNLNQNDN